MSFIPRKHHRSCKSNPHFYISCRPKKTNPCVNLEPSTRIFMDSETKAKPRFINHEDLRAVIPNQHREHGSPTYSYILKHMLNNCDFNIMIFYGGCMWREKIQVIKIYNLHNVTTLLKMYQSNMNEN